jgi:ankyrin repeat protein
MVNQVKPQRSFFGLLSTAWDGACRIYCGLTSTPHELIYGPEATLRYAASLGDTKEIRFLLKKKVDPTAADNKGLTALHYAAWYGKTSAVRLLANTPAVNINALAYIEGDESRELGGETPLHLAAQKGHLDAVNALLDCKGIFIGGAHTAEELAGCMGHKKVAEILENKRKELDRVRREAEKAELLLSQQIPQETNPPPVIISSIVPATPAAPIVPAEQTVILAKTLCP